MEEHWKDSLVLSQALHHSEEQRLGLAMGAWRNDHPAPQPPPQELSSPSASSAVTNTSGSPLREHDYIGLAKVPALRPYSSRPQAHPALPVESVPTDLNLELGLGRPINGSTAKAPQDAIALDNAEPPCVPLAKCSSNQETSFTDSTVMLPAAAFGHDNGGPWVLPASMSTYALPSKLTLKRVFSETSQRAPVTGVSPFKGSSAFMAPKQPQECDSKIFPPHSPQAAVFLKAHISSHPKLEHDPASQDAHQPPNHRRGASVPASQTEKASGFHWSKDSIPPCEKDFHAPEPPPSKGQVVGWPPVRSYRKNTLAAHIKPNKDKGEGNLRAVYVKVNMDGVPIGRKVDLTAYSSYEGLATGLEEMFGNVSNGYGSRPEFALTYEDKDGDWMLVGDVPWGMFVDTVRRIRIMRGAEVSGLCKVGAARAPP